MRRLLLALLCVFLVPEAAVGQSQNLRLGVRSGLNFSTFRGETVQLFDVIDSPRLGHRTSVHFGVGASFPLRRRLFLHGELLYVQKGATFQGDFFRENSVEGTYRFSYLHLPLLLQFSFPLDAIATPYLSAGPALDVSTVSGIETQYAGDTTLRNLDDRTKSVGIGGVVGAGFWAPLSDGLYLVGDLRYNPGLSDVTTADSRIRTDTILISFGVFFSL